MEVSKFEPPVISSPAHFITNPTGPSLIVFPVNILDPQNLGSIIRSASFYACTALVTPLKDSCDFTPIVSKASAGSMETFEEIYRTKSVRKFLGEAKADGFKIIGTSVKTNESVQLESYNIENAANDRLVLLLGAYDRLISLYLSTSTFKYFRERRERSFIPSCFTLRC